MCVAREIAQHLLRSPKWALAVDHPFAVAQRRQIGGEGFAVAERGVLAEELQLCGAQLEDAELLFRRGDPPQAIFSFKHALVQNAAYENLLKSRRQVLHRRIADTLRD